MRTRTSRTLMVALAVTAAASTLPVTAAPAPRIDRSDQAVMREYAVDTWRSMVAMTDPSTGLPADNIEGDLSTTSRSRFTSPTNVGAYLWSTVVARELDIIGEGEARQLMARTLGSIRQLERHEPSGMFYNWYDPVTLEKLRVWPVDGSVVQPFLSSVDNGWLAAALMIVRTAEPRLAHRAERLLEDMDFGYYYDPLARGPGLPGLLRGGFWPEQPPGDSIPDNYRGGPDVYFTTNHYGVLNTEPRVASYIGIARGQIPAEHYFAMWRTFPDTCEWSWPERKPVGVTRTYLGVDVFEGAFPYRGTSIVPSWGGSMFEALMPALVVPEERWGPRSWGINHPRYVQAQIEHGLVEAGYGYWGFSPSSDPAGGYREYGVDAIGSNPDGYSSDQERTLVDAGFPGCPGRDPQPDPASYGDGVVTPHAVFLALLYDRRAALDNLAALRADFQVYGPGGFYDAVAVRSGVVAQRYLSLDQGMVMAALGNVLDHDGVRKAFVRGEIREAIRPLLRREEFSTGG